MLVFLNAISDRSPAGEVAKHWKTCYLAFCSGWGVTPPLIHYYVTSCEENKAYFTELEKTIYRYIYSCGHNANFYIYLQSVAYALLGGITTWPCAAFKYYSLRLSEVIRRHRYWSSLARVMACCLTEASHYLNYLTYRWRSVAQSSYQLRRECSSYKFVKWV